MFYLKYLFLFLVIVPIYGQKVNFNKGKSVNKNFYTEINYTEVQGKIIIPVVIEENTYHFLLDTGAPNVITYGLFEKINSKSIKTITIKDANNKKMKMHVVSLPFITIGEATFKNIPTIVNHKTTNLIFDCFEIDGIIGSNLLRTTIIQFLPKEKLIKIADNKNKIYYNEKEAIDLFLQGKQSSPFIWIDLKGKSSVKEFVLFDTGMKGFYDLSISKYDSYKSKNAFVKNSEAMGVQSIGLFGPSNKNKQYRLIVPQLKINNSIFNNVITITTSSNRSRLGSDILKYGNVLIDYKNKKFVFTPFEGSVDLNEKTLGISPIIIDDKFVVGMVWDDDLKEIISFGDNIVSINGVSFNEINICDIITKESVFKEKDTLEIEFSDIKGTLRKIKLIKEFPNISVDGNKDI